MNRETCTLIVFARAPIPGQVKTRLIPALGTSGAAELQQRLLENTLAMSEQLHDCATELWCHPDTEHPTFQHLSEKYRLPLKQQQGGDLGERMAHALTSVLARRRHAIIIGTDCPHLNAADIEQCLHLLTEGHDAVIGPAEDGGYYLLGLSRMEPALFQGVSWGGDKVLETTRKRLAECNMSWQELGTRHDLDRPDDLQHFPELHLPNRSGE